MVVQRLDVLCVCFQNQIKCFFFGYFVPEMIFEHNGHKCRVIKTTLRLKKNPCTCNVEYHSQIGGSGFSQPKHQLGHPEKIFFSLSKKIFSGLRYPHFF